MLLGGSLCHILFIKCQSTCHPLSTISCPKSHCQLLLKSWHRLCKNILPHPSWSSKPHLLQSSLNSFLSLPYPVRNQPPSLSFWFIFSPFLFLFSLPHPISLSTPSCILLSSISFPVLSHTLNPLPGILSLFLLWCYHNPDPFSCCDAKYNNPGSPHHQWETSELHSHALLSIKPRWLCYATYSLMFVYPLKCGRGGLHCNPTHSGNHQNSGNSWTPENWDHWNLSFPSQESYKRHHTINRAVSGPPISHYCRIF